jgi:hypothetical protein
MHDAVLLVLPKWNVYVMTAEMALSPNQNSCSRRIRLQFSDGLCSVTANESRARLQMASDEKDGICDSVHTIAVSLPSLSNFPAPTGASGDPLQGAGILNQSRPWLVVARAQNPRQNY